MPIFDDIPDVPQGTDAQSSQQPAPKLQTASPQDTSALNWMATGTANRADPTQFGMPSYYDDLPALERNQDPKERTLSVLANSGMLGALPYLRAGAEAVNRGENFWGGSPRYERERKALQRYYSDAYERASDPVKVLGGIGLPGGPMAQAGKYLTSASRPIATGGALGAGQAGVAGYLAPIEPAAGDVTERLKSAAEAAPYGALFGAGAGAAGKIAQGARPRLSTPEELESFHQKIAGTAPEYQPNPFNENVRAAETIRDRGRLIEDHAGRTKPQEAQPEIPPEKPIPGKGLFDDIPDVTPSETQNAPVKTGEGIEEGKEPAERPIASSSSDPVPPEFVGKAPKGPLITTGRGDDTGAWFIDGDKPVYTNTTRNSLNGLFGPQYAKKFDEYPHLSGTTRSGSPATVWYKPGEEARANQVLDALGNRENGFSEEYHRKLGNALGYPSESVEKYIQARSDIQSNPLAALSENDPFRGIFPEGQQGEAYAMKLTDAEPFLFNAVERSNRLDKVASDLESGNITDKTRMTLGFATQDLDLLAKKMGLGEGREQSAPVEIALQDAKQARDALQAAYEARDPEQFNAASQALKNALTEAVQGRIEVARQRNEPDAFNYWMENHVPEGVKADLQSNEANAIGPLEGRAQIQNYIRSQLAAGKPHEIEPMVLAGTKAIIQAHAHEIPSEVPVATLTKLVPVHGGADVELTFETPDGRTFSDLIDAKDLFRNRAIFDTRQHIIALFEVGGRGSSHEMAKALGGGIRHEGIHASRFLGKWIEGEWSALLDHAENVLHSLDWDAYDWFKFIGLNPADNNKGVSLRGEYEYNYRKLPPEQRTEYLNQETIAHMVEAYHHIAQLPSDHPIYQRLMPLYEPIEPLLYKLFTGEIAARTPEDVAQLGNQGKAYAIGPEAAKEPIARNIDPLGYYSGALEAAKNLKQAKGTPEQMLAQLKKGGAKDAEIEATKLRTFLEGKKSVTRDDIVKFLEENRVRLSEVTYSGKPANEVDELYGQLAPSYGGQTRLPNAKWQEYSLDPDNPTYRETMLHLPAKELPPGAREKIAQERFGRSFADLTPLQQAGVDAEVAEPHSLTNFQSGHFPEPNITGHMMTSMVKDAQGRNVFNVDQIQSDWGQKLREGGVRDEAKIAELARRLDAVEKEFYGLSQSEKYEPHTYGLLEQKPYFLDAPEGHDVKMTERAESIWNKKQLLKAELDTAKASATGHPLVNTTDQWVRTTLRRALNQAIAAGADAISIPTGDTVLSYNPGDKHGMNEFYNKIVPLALQKIMRSYDPAYPKPEFADKLVTPNRGAVERSGNYEVEAARASSAAEETARDFVTEAGGRQEAIRLIKKNLEKMPSAPISAARKLTDLEMKLEETYQARDRALAGNDIGRAREIERQARQIATERNGLRQAASFSSNSNSDFERASMEDALAFLESDKPITPTHKFGFTLFPITHAVKESVKGGQPLFAKGGAVRSIKNAPYTGIVRGDLKARAAMLSEAGCALGRTRNRLRPLPQASFAVSGE